MDNARTAFSFHFTWNFCQLMSKSDFPFSIAFATLCLMVNCVFAQRDLRDIPPADPKLEQASFRVADGLEVNLWAADPLLAKPTQISFDNRGRLWVSSSETYPQLNVNQDPSDRIVVLEDSDSDGVADKSSVFYDQLLIPGGVLPDGLGGAYVAHAEQLIYLADRDHDGKADDKQVLLSGFGTEDTHHTLHRLRWGPGGLMYMLQGYYIGTHVETLYGPRRLNGGGLWSYDTRTRRLEIYSRGLTNPWGVTFDRWGQTFQTDGAGGEGINYSFPDSVFRSSPHENRILRGLNPGRPKLCGIEIISGSHFPESLRGSMLANDFRANNIDRYLVEEKGSAYTSTLQEDILQSTHVSFRPIDIVMGPDGAIYIADWYSPIIQHGEVDFRDERRDQVHGRIWRITAKDRPLSKPVDYQNSSNQELLELLKSDEDWIRLNAKQALKTRDQHQVTQAINQWVANLDRSHPEYEHHRLEALWAYQTVSTVRSRQLVHEVMQSPDHRARAAAIRVLYHWRDSPTIFEDAVSDPHPRVRREAVTTLGQIRSAEAARIALKVLDHPMDEYLDFALWRTCRLLAPYWLPAFKKNELTFDGNAEHLAFALKAIEQPDALAPLVEMIRDGKNADPSIVSLIGKIGTSSDLDVLLQIAKRKKDALLLPASLALLEAAADRKVFPNDGSALLSACKNLLSSDDDTAIATACRLVGLWRVEELAGELAARLVNPDIKIRVAAAESLADLGSDQILSRIAGDVREKTATRISAAVALVRLDPSQGAKMAADLLVGNLTELQAEQLMGAILVKKGAAEELSSELAKRKVPQSTAIYAIRLVETFGDNNPKLKATLATAGNVKSGPQVVDQVKMESLISMLKAADAERGQKIYNREKLTCKKCHIVHGVGGKIGPDLSSIGASAPVDYLIESLLEPSRKIKEGYRMSMIATEEGDVYSGAVLREDENVVVVQNSVGKQTRVPKSAIVSRRTSPVSMMPSGLTASLREDEFLDLIAYLASLGKTKN